MKKSSTQLLNEVAGILNGHVEAGGPVLDLLSANPPVALELINEILRTSAEGARLITARETDGTIVGFVPHFLIPKLNKAQEVRPVVQPPVSPEDE